MEIQTGVIEIKDGEGCARTGVGTTTFSKDVKTATPVLRGIDFGYSHPNDEHLGNVRIELRTQQITKNVVVTQLTLEVRDWSGDCDNSYRGKIYYAVLAELVS